jgi:UDP-glucose:tetrahydrobiopterin glucosyltransferase
MRIAIIAPLVTPISEPQRGGSQAVVADLALGLRARGHDVDVYASSGSLITGVNVIDAGVRSEDLAGTLYRHARPASGPSDSRAVSDVIAQRAFQQVFELVDRVSYDVVHNHAFDQPAVRLAAQLRAPVVHTLHLPPDPAMAAVLSHAAHAANRPTVAAVSDASAAGWRKLTRVDVVLRNGVPVDRMPWSTDGGAKLLFAGRFSAEKGAADAIAVARAAGIPIELYGDPYDPDYMREEIEPHRHDRGVTIHSGIPRAELWSVMAAARAVLCPARWEEPFGMVAAEAQAAGTPVIAYRRGALPEVVADRKTGFLVPEGDVDAAVSAVLGLGTIDRAACRRHAETTLTLESAIAAHERLYQKLAARAELREHA